MWAARFSAGCSEAAWPSGLWIRHKGRCEESLKLRWCVHLRHPSQQVINTHCSEAWNENRWIVQIIFNTTYSSLWPISWYAALSFNTPMERSALYRRSKLTQLTSNTGARSCKAALLTTELLCSVNIQLQGTLGQRKPLLCSAEASLCVEYDVQQIGHFM